MSTCAHCGVTIKQPRDGQKFCKDKCRAAWHREHTRGSLPGEVRGLRALKSGGWSLIIHLPDQPLYKIGDRVAVIREIGAANG